MEQPCNAILVAEETNVGDGSSVTVGCVQVDWTGTTICKGTSVDARFGLLSVPKRYSGRGVGTLLISAAGVLLLSLLLFHAGPSMDVHFNSHFLSLTICKYLVPQKRALQF